MLFIHDESPLASMRYPIVSRFRRRPIRRAAAAAHPQENIRLKDEGVEEESGKLVHGVQENTPPKSTTLLKSTEIKVYARKGRL